MFTVFTFGTPHGHRATITLEEMGLPYRIHKVDFTGEGVRDPGLTAISPLGKIPAMLDQTADTPVPIFESGAILLYLARKTGLLLPSDPAEEPGFYSWLMLALTDLTHATIGHFRFSVLAPEPVPYAVEHFAREAGRCFQVMDRRLDECPYLGGTSYTIADIAAWPFIDAAEKGGAVDGLPALRRWHADIAARPGVIRGMAQPQ